MFGNKNTLKRKANFSKFAKPGGKKQKVSNGEPAT
jgi:hypothetical protein